MRQNIKDLNLEDDFLFAKVMADLSICKKVIEIILGIEIEKIDLPQEQKVIDILLESKGVRLDVYVKDNKHTIYNVEIQRGHYKNLPLRSRYYQGNIDLDMIAKGEPYDNLQTSFIIFICTFDLFKLGRHIYTFENMCKEVSGLSLDDKTTKVFLNTKGTIDDIGDDLKEFLKYLENSTDSYASVTQSELVKQIHKKVIEVKQSKEMEAEYMTLLQRDREKLDEGLVLGLNLASKIIKLSKKGYTINQIATELRLAEEQVKQIIDDME